MRGKVGREFALVGLCHAEPAQARAWSLLASGDPLQDIIGKVRLGELSVIDNIDAAFDLLLDDLCYR